MSPRLFLVVVAFNFIGPLAEVLEDIRESRIAELLDFVSYLVYHRICLRLGSDGTRRCCARTT